MRSLFSIKFYPKEDHPTPREIKRLWLRPDGPGPLFAAVLVLAAIAVAVLQAVLGVQLVGRHGAHDGSFATYTLIQYQTELAQGHGLPRWSFDGNFGLGSPIFYIYPPGAFAVAAWVGNLLPSLAAPTLLNVVGILFRIGAIVTCALWLRRHTSLGSAITGGALYALMPYVSVINPQVRLAFAETAAAALLPLVFLAVDLGAAQVVRTIVLVSAAMALLAISHLPSTVLAGGLVVSYAIVGRRRRDVVRRTTGTLLGILLGLALAGATVIPAIALLPAITSAAFTAPQNLPTNHFLFVHLFESGSWVFNLAIIPPLVMTVLALRSAVTIGRRSLAIAFTLGVAVFLTTPTSLPFWELLPPLEMVQFPWRLLLPISLLAAGLLAIALRRLSGQLRWLVLAGALAEAAVAMLFAVAYGDHGRSAQAAQAAALNDWLANEAEYIPADAGSKGWLPVHDAGATAFRRIAGALPGCSAHRQLAKTRTSEGLAINVAGCVGPTPLPQFYFPGWSAAAAASLPVDPDPATGLARVNVPPGTETVTLTRKILPQETAGLQVTAAALLLWLAALLAAFYPARTLTPTGRLSPIGRRVTVRE